MNKSPAPPDLAALLACAEAATFYESGIYLWDVAAAGLIVDQAGGHTEIMATGPPSPIADYGQQRPLARPVEKDADVGKGFPLVLH